MLPKLQGTLWRQQSTSLASEILEKWRNAGQHLVWTPVSCQELANIFCNGQIVEYLMFCRPDHSILLLEHGRGLREMNECSCIPIKFYKNKQWAILDPNVMPLNLLFLQFEMHIIFLFVLRWNSNHQWRPYPFSLPYFYPKQKGLHFRSECASVLSVLRSLIIT